jgi:23S rRNA (guanine2445-N2)-methyltransferase / 23S rRNA (guanine2069-N7)-methyltransferase
VAAFPAKNEEALYQGILAVDWSVWLSANGTLAVDADVRSSFTTHSLYVAQLAKDAVVDQFRERTGRRPSVDLERPTLRIVVSLFQDQAQIYVDSSGESLHKRGYRKRSGEAPVSETLAAGIIRLSGWDGKAPLLDAMCGSGTLAIEAGLIARNVAPGLLRRHFGYQSWPDYDRQLHERLIAEARESVNREAKPVIKGFEIDPEMVEIARENVERAGLSDLIKIEKADFFAQPAPAEKGELVMNPPYDERLPVDNVAELYQRIGDRLKHAYGGWTAHILAGNRDALKYFGLRSSRRIPLYNGSIECRLMEYELRAGENEISEAPAYRRAAEVIRPEWKSKADAFANRLRKSDKHYGKWAKREGISCWRVYDRDIPELPFIVDRYGDRVHFAEVQRNHDHSPIEHTRYMELMVETAGRVLGVEGKRVYFKKRKPQSSGGFQYTPHAATDEYLEVTEGGHRFLVNLADYLDVGLFLDHRRTRAMVEREAKGKDFLNLFAYTGSFSVYAAAGGAKSTTTVDTSRTYLGWAEENLRRNGFSGPKHRIIRSDTAEFLESTSLCFDLCVVDPPTRSVNRSSGRVFGVQEDHVALLQRVLERMRPGGKVYFSTNYRTFQIDEAALRHGRKLDLKEITKQTIPLDFERKPSHRCWLIELPS